MQPVELFLQAIWSNSNTSCPFSWRRLNQAMHSGLFLTVRAGFPFFASDLAAITGRFRGGRWIGEGGLDRLYALAVEVDNKDATKVLEEHFGMTAPFIVDDVDIGSVYRKRGRVAVGARFQWAGRSVEVTSVGCDHFVAVARDGGKARRFKITRAAIKAARSEAKAKAKGNDRPSRLGVHAELFDKE